MAVADGPTVELAIAGWVRSGAMCTCVHIGAEFASLGGGEYVVNPDSDQDLARVLEALEERLRCRVWFTPGD